jgi:hypothetical protein
MRVHPIVTHHMTLREGVTIGLVWAGFILTCALVCFGFWVMLHWERVASWF